METLNDVTYGTVSFERGFEIVDVSGYVAIDVVFLYVYGDASRPLREQRRTAIPLSRVVEIDYGL